MLVYRVEHPLTHEGPYRHLSMRNEHTRITEKMVTRHNNDRYNHPTPYNDGIRNNWRECCCGFSTLDSLHRWFDGYLEELHHIGFALAKIEVPNDDVAFGEKQVVFRPSRVINRTLHPLVEGAV